MSIHVLYVFPRKIYISYNDPYERKPMFKNHALRFQVVKNPQSDADTERRFRSMVEIVQYNKLLKDNLHYVAVLTGSASF